MVESAGQSETSRGGGEREEGWLNCGAERKNKKNKGKAAATAEWLISCHQARRGIIVAHCDITKGSEVTKQSRGSLKLHVV